MLLHLLVGFKDNIFVPPGLFMFMLPPSLEKTPTPTLNYLMLNVLVSLCVSSTHVVAEDPRAGRNTTCLKH